MDVAGTQPSFGDSIASLEFTGYSVERLAPGVQGALGRFNGVPSFFNTYLTTAAEEERGTTEVTNFAGAVQLGENGYTGRYADGLPPEAAR
ncbi:MAG: hypothetical protein H0V19_09025 [Euzebyales bacterium]|nr:hypothetical protein [Euzebyales bacterium]